MEIKKGYPFLPLVDSLFGECLFSAWVQLNLSEDLLQSKLSRFLPSAQHYEEGFICTKNTDKEIIHSRAPEEIRELLTKNEYIQVANVLISISKGEYMQVTNPSLDVAFELLEWILTGFDEDCILNVLRHYLSLGEEDINSNLIQSLKYEYSRNF